MTELLPELLQRCRRHEPDAIATLVRRFECWSRELARSIVRDEHLADDAMQSAFATAMTKLPELREPDAFPGWLRQIIRNECQVLLRRAQAVVKLDDRRPDPRRSPAEEAQFQERIRVVREALGALPAISRQPAELYYLREQSCAQIAEALGVPVGTIKRRLHEAREQLRKTLARILPL